jgi:hypothetical protein
MLASRIPAPVKVPQGASGIGLGVEGRMDREPAAEPTYAEMLCELAKGLRDGRSLNLDDYFELLEWATGFIVQKEGKPPWVEVANFKINDVVYALFFMSRNLADEVVSRGENEIVVEAAARELLRRIPDGLGLIVDYGTAAEVRIEPDALTILSEEFRVKRVRQEATKEWLTRVKDQLEQEGVPESQRPARAMQIWGSLNSFRVIQGSRRARKIDQFFATATESNPAATRLRLRTLWDEEYASDPYLHHLTVEQLQERLVDITANMPFVDRGAFPHELEETEWEELLEHVRSEYARRGERVEEGNQAINVPDPWPRLAEAKRAFGEYPGPPGQLFKFGDSQYLEPLLKTGTLKIFPASSYAAPSMRRSRRDDELARSVLLDPRTTRVQRVGLDGVRRPLAVSGSIRRTMRSSTDYYVWCTTTGFDPRLFDDFTANSCLIIHDGLAFGNRIHAAIERRLPGWYGADKLVRYFDPLRPEWRVLSTLHKDFRFSYQREYRFLWNPGARIARLDPVDIVLDSLEDIASLIKIK